MKKLLTCLVVVLFVAPSAAQAQSWTGLLQRPPAPQMLKTPSDYSWPNPAENAMIFLHAQQQVEQIKAQRFQNEITQRQLQRMDAQRQAEATKLPEPAATPTPLPDAATLIFHARMAKAAETDPEIMKIAADKTLPVSLPMALVIKDSEHPAQLIRYIDSHRTDAAKITRLETIPAVHAMEAIKASLNALKK